MTSTEIDTDTPPYGPRDHWTRIYGEGRRWYRHTWTGEDLAAHLADALPDGSYSTAEARIEDANGETVAYLVDAAEMATLENARHEIEKLKEAPRDTAMHPAVNGPGGGGDGLLIDTDGIERELAWVYARREVGEPPQGDDRTPDSLQEWRDRVKAVADRIEKTPDDYGLLTSAVNIALTTKLPADERGVVPVRMWCKRDDGAETEAQWTLAYTTPARGLFVRGGNPSLFGETYTVVTGSGYAIRAGFVDREVATEFAVAIAEAVPGIDWRIWETPWTETPKAILEALSAVAKEWSVFGRHEDDKTNTPN
jgi:hypothetical protein